MFATAPISLAAIQQFHWSVIYNPNDVVLKLDDITLAVPEPSSLALLIAGAVMIGGARRECGRRSAQWQAHLR